MPGHTRVGGVWKQLDGIHVKVSGVWKEVNNAYTRVGGVWKQWYAAVAVTLSGEAGINDDALDPDDARVGVRWNSDGTLDKNIDTSYIQIDATTDWIIPNGADKTGMVVRCTDNNANLAAGSAGTGSWLSASATRTWFITQTTIGSKLLDITLEVSLDSGSTVHDSAGYTGTAEVLV